MKRNDTTPTRRNRPFVLLVIALALLLYGISQPLLMIVGSETGGVITSVRRQGGSVGQSHNDYWWVAGYEFVASDGGTYWGSTRSLGASHSSLRYAKGQVRRVLYLESFPHYNALKRNAEPSLGHGILVGVGCFILWISRKKHSRRSGTVGNQVTALKRGSRGVGEENAPRVAMTAAETLAWAERYRRHSRLYVGVFLAVLIPAVFLIIRFSTDDLDGEVYASLGVFILITGALAFLSRKDTNRSWRGIVEEKIVRRRTVRREDDLPDETIQVPMLVVRTDRNRKVAMRVSRDLFEYFNEGDRVVKIAGFDWPEKEVSSEGRRVCIVCGHLLSIGGSHCPRCGGPIPDLGALLTG